MTGDFPYWTSQQAMQQYSQQLLSAMAQQQMQHAQQAQKAQWDDQWNANAYQQPKQTLAGFTKQLRERVNQLCDMLRTGFPDADLKAGVAFDESNQQHLIEICGCAWRVQTLEDLANIERQILERVSDVLLSAVDHVRLDTLYGTRVLYR